MSERERTWWIVAAVMAAMFAAAAALTFGHVMAGSASDGGSSSTHYLEVRAECEQRATAALPVQYAPGGQHWADMVNACMIDHP